jgi:tetratricopeptide (TPR) repeat protein
MTGTAVQDLESIAQRRHRDPEQALLLAQIVLGEHAGGQIGAVARWAIGLALHELGRLGEAIDSLLVAAEISVSTGPAGHEARTRAALAVSMLSAGRAQEASHQLALARAVATPTSQGYVEMVSGLLSQRSGRLGEAQAAYSRALRLLQRVDDRHSVARLMLNRGALRAYRGDLAGAVNDLTAAEAIANELQLPLLAAMAAHNLGFAYGRRSDVPRALTAFSRAEAAYALGASPGSHAAVLQADLCEVLLDAGLIPEARRAAERAVAAVTMGDDTSYLSECRLLHARALLADARWSLASEEAAAAGAEFRASGRLPWAALADYVDIQAEVLASEDSAAPPKGLLERCRQVAMLLEENGWRVEAGHVRTFVGRIALAVGRPDAGRQELANEAAAHRRGTTDQRAQTCLLRALVALSDGDRPAARRALSEGMRLVERHVATLGSTELRARAASHSADLARLGLRMAWDDARPSEVLRWAERWRATSLRRPPVRPEDHDQSSEALAELRRVRSEIHQGILEGTPTNVLQREAIAKEEALQRRSFATPGDTLAIISPTLRTLRHALRGRSLVEYIRLDGRLLAVTLTGSSAQLVDLAALADVADELAYMMFAVRQATRLQGGDPISTRLEADALRLGQLLVDPLHLPANGPLVIVPTGMLHGLAWGHLPTLVDRDVTVAPSALLWAQGATAAPAARSERATLIAGPELPGADDEVDQISSLYPNATVLRGAAATAPAVLASLERSDIVHIAAHGRFRADSPLFSSFLLSDGPLTVHDLERSSRVPETVVLACCHAALTNVAVGDELIGTAATLLALGAQTVIAPVEAVPDLATAPFTVDLHRALRAGVAPSAALAALRRGSHAAVARLFLCIGGGGSRRPQ